MKKRAMSTLGELLAILLFIIILIPTCTLINNVFRVSDKGAESFNNLAATITEVGGQPIGTTRSVPLYLDEDTAILAFAPNADSLLPIYIQEYGAGLGTVAGKAILRPESCPQDQYCLVLCRRFSETGILQQAAFTTFNARGYEQLRCVDSIPAKNLPRTLSGGVPFSAAGHGEPCFSGRCYIDQPTGFIIERGIISDEQTRIQGVTIKKNRDNQVSICTSARCV